MVLVRALERVYYDNTLYQPGDVFDYRGKIPSVGIGPIEDARNPAAAPPETIGGKPVPPEWTTAGFQRAEERRRAVAEEALAEAASAPRRQSEDAGAESRRGALDTIKTMMQ